jgi:hypothetical protein
MVPACSEDLHRSVSVVSAEARCHQLSETSEALKSRCVPLALPVQSCPQTLVLKSTGEACGTRFSRASHMVLARKNGAGRRIGKRLTSATHKAATKMQRDSE